MKTNENNNIETKKCTSCQQSKPISEFGGSTSSKDGLASYCKQCHKLKKYKRKGVEWAVEGFNSETDHFNASLEEFAKIIPPFVEDPEAVRKQILSHRK